ncbi:MAG: rhomboid family intramembrane serine protease [Clostridia bacterium]
MDRDTRNYWRQQRRLNQRYNRPYRGGGTFSSAPVTIVLIGLMVLTTLIGQVVPGWGFYLTALPGGRLLLILVSAVNPGSLLSLVFAGLFVWLLGSQLESMMTRWQYLLVFFASGIVGELLSGAVAGFGLGGSVAAFGLAGAYAFYLARSQGSGPSMQWVLILLLINVVFTGFNLAALLSMFGAFGTGLAVMAVTTQGRL